MPQGLPPLQVRPRVDADLAALAVALRRVHEQDGYPRRWHEPADAWIATDATVAAWVAAGPEPVGHVALEDEGGGLHVGRLFVDPLARGRGAADLLLDAVEAAAGDRPLSLEVDVHGVGAIRRYERRGWTRVDTHDAHWYEPDGTRARCHTYVAPRAAGPRTRFRATTSNEGPR